MLDKLLSHRLRGFAEIENSLSAVVEGFESQVNYFEIDTRVSADGKIYVHHDPTIPFNGKTLYFCREHSQTLERVRYGTGEPLLPFNCLLAHFKPYASKGRLLYIDIKDYGFEEEHLSAVRSYNLEESVAFVSWIPQTLLKLSELGTSAPLFLSHVNLHKLGKGGRFLSRILENTRFRFFNQIITGTAKTSTPPPDRWAAGYQHTLICTDLPSPFPGILSQNNGGICVSCNDCAPALLDYCERNTLNLLVFSVSTTKEFLKYANLPGIQKVFCDNAPNVYNELQNPIPSAGNHQLPEGLPGVQGELYPLPRGGPPGAPRVGAPGGPPEA